VRQDTDGRVSVQLTMRRRSANSHAPSCLTNVLSQPHPPRDRRRAVCLAEHRQHPDPPDLRQARRHRPILGRAARPRTEAAVIRPRL